MDLIQFLEGSFLISGGLFSFFWGLNLILINPKLKQMSWILWIASLWLFSGAYVFTGFHLHYPQFYLLHLPFVYTVGPFFFSFYKEVILEEKFTGLFFHFVVSFLVVIFILPYHLKSFQDQLVFLESMKSRQITIYHGIILFLNLGTKISLLSYLLPILWQNRKIFQTNLGSSEKTKKVFLFMVGLLFIDLFLGLLGFIFQSFILIKLSALLLPLNLYIFFVASSKYPEMISGIQTEIKKARYEQSKIERLVDLILEKNPQAIEDYRKGKDRALGSLVGAVMKESKGKAVQAAQAGRRPIWSRTRVIGGA